MVNYEHWNQMTFSSIRQFFCKPNRILNTESYVIVRTKRVYIFIFLVALLFVFISTMQRNRFLIFYTEQTLQNIDINIRVFNLNESESISLNGASLGWMRTTLYEILDKFHPRTLDTCPNQCNQTDSFCNAVSFDDWTNLINQSKLSFVPLLGDKQYIYDFEREYLSYPPLQDKRELPDMTLSKVFLQVDKDNVSHCIINDVINGRVDLVDGYGNPRKTGGDEVRVWIVDTNDTNFRAAGQVTDMRNGSYQISVRCLWPGVVKVYVAVAYPREYLRVTMLQRRVGNSRLIAGKFMNNETEEVTVCWGQPDVPGRPCLCNLTSTNRHPFYCGRPLDKRLSCDNFKATMSLSKIQPSNVTLEEIALIKSVAVRDIKVNALRVNIKILVNNKGSLPQLPPCYKTSPSATWEMTKPKGYWSPGGVWTSLVCDHSYLTPGLVLDCLRDTSIWVFGDSNSLRLYWPLQGWTQCSTTGNGAWPQKEVCKNKRNNITLTFTPHEYPLYLGPTWTNKLPYDGVVQHIDAMPSNGKIIVIFHYYLHVLTSHLSFAELRLRSVTEACKRLLDRNPDATIAFRGPHVASLDCEINHTISGDSLGTFYFKIILNVFKDLMNRIIFLDGWDMTIALENAYFHPTDNVPKFHINFLLSFRCNTTG